MKSCEADEGEWLLAELKRKNLAQAKALKEQAKAGGLQFNVYVPPGLADWLLELVEEGTFLDPSEAVFVMLQEQQELEPHQDLREELLRRKLQAAMDDPHPGIPIEEVIEQLREKQETTPEPATWENQRLID